MIAATPYKMIIVTGPAGVGRSSVIQEAQKTADFVRAISTTTRPKRPDEINGEHHYFTTWEDFKSKAENGDMLTAYEYKGHQYGFAKQEIERLENTQKPIVIKTRLEEALKIKDQYPLAQLVFIAAPMQYLRQRLALQGYVSENVLSERLLKAKQIMDQAPLLADHIIVNEENNLAKAAAELIQLINQ